MVGNLTFLTTLQLRHPSVQCRDGRRGALPSAWEIKMKAVAVDLIIPHLLRKHVRVILESGSKTVMTRDCLNCCSTQIKRLPVYEAGVRPAAKAPRPKTEAEPRVYLPIPGS